MKRAYEPARPDDGARVLVDRLWPRGVRKDDLKLTLWLKDIAPSTELREWFGHDPARFKEFARRYREELRANEGALAPLEQLLGSGRATLIYAARDADHNEAVVLADYLRERFRTG
nr:DUF488 domain-containing protein [Ancylobacter novellus]